MPMLESEILKNKRCVHRLIHEHTNQHTNRKVTKEGMIVEFNQVSHRYGKQLVLDHVSFSVKKGESICLIGPNGGGKSTVLKLILGLLSPSQGTIEVLGVSPKTARDRVSYVPQSIQFDPLFPVSAMDIVLMGRLHRLGFGHYSKSSHEAAEQALTDVGLDDERHCPFAELSGGQRQRVLIARALASHPELLLLDEPTANIDLSVEAAFLETLKSLRKKMTIMLVTHDLDVISEVGDSVLCVNRRVHRHSLPLNPETIKEIYSGSFRIEHDRRVRHEQGDHTSCNHQ